MTNLIKRLGISALALAAVGVSAYAAAPQKENLTLSYAGKTGNKSGLYECAIKSPTFEDCYRKSGNGVSRVLKEGDKGFYIDSKKGKQPLNGFNAVKTEVAKKVEVAPKTIVPKKTSIADVVLGEKGKEKSFDNSGNMSPQVYAEVMRSIDNCAKDAKLCSDPMEGGIWDMIGNGKYSLTNPLGSVMNHPSFNDVRYTVGFTTEGVNGSVDFRLGNSNFRLGPYVQLRDNVVSDKKHSSKPRMTATELVGPGVYRQRADKVETKTETSLDNPEYGARIGYVLPGKPVEIFATLGMTEKKTLESKTYSSDVTFTRTDGTQIGDTQHAQSKPSKKKDKTNIAALGVGGSLMLTENWSLDASAKSVDDKLSGLVGLGFRW